jgi:hypothetical protein
MLIFLQFFCNHWKYDHYASIMSAWTATSRKYLLFTNLQRQTNVTET